MLQQTGYFFYYFIKQTKINKMNLQKCLKNSRTKTRKFLINYTIFTCLLCFMASKDYIFIITRRWHFIIKFLRHYNVCVFLLLFYCIVLWSCKQFYIRKYSSIFLISLWELLGHKIKLLRENFERLFLTHFCSLTFVTTFFPSFYL